MKADVEGEQGQVQLEGLFALSLEMLCIAGVDGYFKRVNPAFERTLGYSREELLSRPFIEFVHPEDREKTLEEVRKLSHGVPTVHFGNRYRCKDGSHRFIAWTAAPDEQRKLIYATASDVTEHKRMHEALQRGEQRYRGLLDAVTTYTYTAHVAEGVVVSTEHSEGCLAATGYAPGDYAADPYLWISMVHPEDRKDVRQRIAAVFAGEPVPPIEHRIIHRDGSVRWIRDTILPHHDGRGLLVRYDGVVEDITERKLAQQRTEASLQHQTAISALLRRSLESVSLTEHLEQALDLLLSLPWITLEPRGAVFLVEGDPDVLVLKAQRGLPEEVRDACREVPIGRCLCGLAAGTREIVFADGSDPRHTRQYCGIHPHGHYCVPIVSDGQLQGLLDLYVEEGHRRAPEEEAFLSAVADALAGTIQLKRSEERLRRLIECAPDALVIIDSSGTIILVNAQAERMFGYTREELIGQSIAVLVPERFRDRHTEHVKLFLDSPHTGQMGSGADFLALRKDGSEFPSEVLLGALQSDGRMLVSAAIRDITQRKRMEAELREREGDLLAARRVQQYLLPRAAPAMPGFDIAGAVYPADYAAGDLFDYVTTADGSLGVVIADVDGHGVQASLLSTTVRAYLRPLMKTRSSMAEILGVANAILTDETEDDRFVTLLLGCLDPRTRTFVYASAGHTTSYVLDQSNDVKARLESTSLPLGVLSDAEFAAAEPIPLARGDVLLLLTDGVTEALSPVGTCFGPNRALDAVRASRDGSAAEIIRGLRQAICDFSGSDRLLDDVTAVVIKVK